MRKTQILEKLQARGATPSNLTTSIGKLPKKEKEFAQKNENWLRWTMRDQDRKVRFAKEKKRRRDSAKFFGLSQKEYIFLVDKADDLLEQFNTGHSMGCYRRMYLDNNVFSRCDILKAYSNSCKYSPTYGNISIHLTKKELRAGSFIGGIYTIKMKKANSKVWKVRTLIERGAKSSHSVNWEDGYMTSDFHCKTIDEALAWRQSEANRIRLKRTGKISTKQGSRFVGVQDSIKAGNCEIGTLAFARKHNLNPDFGYRLDYLISLESHNLYLQKMI